MAELIVVPLLNRLQDVAVKEAKALAAVGGKIDMLHDKLMWLQALVHETDLRSRHDSNRLIRVLASQIREVSFEAEDAVDKFYLRAGLSRKWRRAALEFIVHFRTQIGVRFVLSREIQSMNARLEEIVNSNKKYSQGNTSENVNKRWRSCRAIPTMRQDWDIELPFFSGVRSEERKDLHMKLRNDSGSKWEVIPIAGVGGVGKRALLKRAYELKGTVASQYEIDDWESQPSQASDSQGQASDGRFNVSVLMSFSQVIQASIMVQQIKEKVGRVCSLRKQQQAEGKIRCLVVIDSPVNSTMWRRLELGLESELKQAGGKILLMTPSPRQVNCSTIKLETLDASGSLKLFNQIYDPNGCKGVDKQQKNIRKNIMKITGGLPLAIVLLARLLTTMDSNKWDAAADYIMNSDEDSKLQTIMSVCIDDLPDELKSCLLFTAGFPKNRDIDAHQLVRLWMAEGVLTHHHELETEKLGQCYLKELIHRGLLQLVHMTSSQGDGGCVEQVAIHDQIHPLLWSEAKRTGFMDFHYGGHTPARSNTRRLSLFKYDEKLDALSKGLGKLRTVVSYFDDCHPKLYCTVMEDQGERQCRDNAAGDGDAGSSLDATASDGTTSPADESGSKRGDRQGKEAQKLDIRKLLDDSPYLRVINLEGINVGKKLPDRIGDMVHLQYLGIRSKELERLPSSVGNLRNLQTIDVRGTGVTKLPKSLWKIQTLRHVLGEELVFPASGDDLKLLRTLETMTIKEGIYHKLLLARWRGRRIGLRFLHRLHVVGLKESQRQDLEAVLQDLSSLENLSLSGDVIPINLFADAPPSCLEHVVSLEIHGKLPYEASDQELLNRLTRLVLESTNITQDFIDVIAKLPDLAELVLHKDSYAEKKLDLCTDCTHAFNSLMLLEISGLSELETIIKPGRRDNIKTRFTDMQCKAKVETCEKCGPEVGAPAAQGGQEPAPARAAQSGQAPAPAEQGGQKPAPAAQGGQVNGVEDPLFFRKMIMEAIGYGQSTKTGIKNYIKNTFGDPVRKLLDQMAQEGDLKAQPHGRYTYYFLGNPKTPSSCPTFREMILEAIKENLSSKTNIELYINRKYGDPVVKALDDLVKKQQLKREKRGGHVYYLLSAGNPAPTTEGHDNNNNNNNN